MSEPQGCSPLIVLTGGGTAGHVVPHLALLPKMRSSGWRIAYIGSRGIERTMLSGEKDVTFYTISTGKLRRYFSWQNFLDIFRIIWGFFQSLFILMKLRPFVVFSKGGFVSVPVAVAAWVLRIPVITHESDLTPGLANRMIERFATRVLYTFPETKKFIRAKRHDLVGLPIRPFILRGDADKFAAFCGMNRDPALVRLLVMGGSQGAATINDAVFAAVPKLAKRFQVVHLCGSGKKSSMQLPHYRAFEFLNDEMADALAWADVVVTRAGASSIFELLACRKPMLLIPLKKGSRGDQVVNAASFEAAGYATSLDEDRLCSDSLIERLEELLRNKDAMIQAQEQGDTDIAGDRILRILQECL